MAKTFKFGENGKWATKTGSSLAYNDQNDNFKPMPFSVTRGSIATRVNKEGLIEVVGHDKLRIDYTDSSKGVALLEPARTNIALYSEELDNSVWTKTNVSIVTNSTTSPDGSQTADKIVASSSSGDKTAYQLITVASGSAHAASAFFKASEYTYAFFRLGGISGNPYVIYDLSTQATVSTSGLTSSSITQIGNGWYKIKVTATSTSTLIAPNLMVIPSSGYVLGSDNVPEFTGDGTSGGFVWGAQLEVGSYATSYIPTSGQSGGVPRAADVANGAGNSEVFNDSEGVLFANIAALANDSTNKFMSISDGSISETIRIAYIGGTEIRFQAIMTSGTGFGKDVEINIRNNNKVCFQYKANNYKVFVNGFSYTVTQRATTPTGISELSFERANGTNPLFSKIKEIGYYDAVLTDAELEALTSYTSFTNMANELNLTIK